MVHVGDAILGCLAQAPDASGPFRFVLLDDEGVASKSGARLFTSRAAFLTELARIGEPKEAVKGLGEDPNDAGARSGAAAPAEDPAAGEGDDHPPAVAVVM